MKLEIKANDFCPDDCRYCDPFLDICNLSEYKWICENKERCKLIAERIKGAEKQNEITHKTE